MVCSPIFIVYLAFLLFLLFFRDNRLKAIAIYVTFIFIFEASSFGSDYSVYKGYYETNTYWRDIEFLYLAISEYCGLIGMPFEIFRFLWGSTWVGLICYSMYKMNKRYFNLSFLIFYLGYLLYALSAFRQLAAMAIGFWCVYRMFYKRDYIIPLVASYLGVMFHKSGYIYFIFFAVCDVYLFLKSLVSKVRRKPLSLKKPSDRFSKICSWMWAILPLLCVAGRIVNYRLVEVAAVKQIIVNLIGSSYYAKTLFNIGLLSRMALLMVTMWVYPHIDKKKEIGPIMLFYVICMAGYILMPMEAFAGRFFNNGRIFEVILIPVIYNRLLSYEQSERRFVNAYGGTYTLPIAKVYLFISLAIYFVIFYQQMSTQMGYSVYTNIFPFLRF